MDTALVMLAAAVLSAASVTILAWRTVRIDGSHPARLIGELHVARWAAILLATVGAITAGLALGRPDVPLGNADAAMGVVFVGAAGLVLQREPREGLLFAAGAFMAHALVTLAHRPGWLSTDVMPRAFAVACAIYDVYLAALCFVVRRRS
jgi:hypothetical protein